MEPFVGEIRMFAGNFAPRGWAFCDGQLLSIPTNDALFSLFGTIYGGDGRTTFGLPDLRGRVPIGMGQGSGLSNRQLGTKLGEETVALSGSNWPSHTHGWEASNAAAQNSNPVGAAVASPTQNIYSDQAPNAQMANGITATGGGQGHQNEQPFLCVNFIVSLFGIYPSRN